MSKSGYFIGYGFQNAKKWRSEVMTDVLTLEEAKRIIGLPMVDQLASLAKKSTNDPIVAAQLLHNTLAKLDNHFQMAAQVVWNNLVSP